MFYKFSPKYILTSLSPIACFLSQEPLWCLPPTPQWPSNIISLKYILWLCPYLNTLVFELGYPGSFIILPILPDFIKLIFISLTLVKWMISVSSVCNLLTWGRRWFGRWTASISIYPLPTLYRKNSRIQISFPPIFYQNFPEILK